MSIIYINTFLNISHMIANYRVTANGNLIILC
jgi:hypothetical protein